MRALCSSLGFGERIFESLKGVFGSSIFEAIDEFAETIIDVMRD